MADRFRLTLAQLNPTVGAIADNADAAHAPLLRTISLNIDADGKPVEYGRTWFSGDRVTLTVADP